MDIESVNIMAGKIVDDEKMKMILMEITDEELIAECNRRILQKEVDEIEDVLCSKNAIDCPYCHKKLRTAWAMQCFRCGADWHKVDW